MYRATAKKYHRTPPPRTLSPAMAEPFKNLVNDALIKRAAAQLERADARFDGKALVKQVVPQLDALELKARAMCVADALERLLPPDFHDAADVLERALAPVAEVDGEELPKVAGDGLSGWFLWAVGEYAARRGVAHPERALTLLHAVTQRFTAEFAIRPLIVAHPTLAYDTLATWVRDPSPHVRRLVSEGTRPRLPWGLQLKSLIANPSPSLPLLAALMDDPSEYVRRSVANHLNDIAKDHPGLIADWLEQHLPSASAERKALLKHASRTLIKAGHARVLHAWGIGATFKGSATLRLSPKRVAIGGAVTLALTVTSTARTTQRLAIDYRVHHVKADGRTTHKVFKGWTLELGPGETRQLTKQHAMKVITTRRYYPGVHAVDIQVNGAVVADASFRLTT
jgi:3-methyladenine DNA glycosylase AlkC